jgi:4-hydroxyphenylpyruvate dioxygenase
MGRGAEGAEPAVSSAEVIDSVAKSEQNPIRFNPRSDKFGVQRFHHVEFWTPDATGAAKRFSWGLGMPMVAKSDLSTQNSTFASYVLQSGELTFALTAPYSRARRREGSTPPLPWYDQDDAYDFLNRHGLAVRAIGIRVDDARQAFEVSTANGAEGVLPPTELRDDGSNTSAVVSEIRAYGDCVLRFISGSFQGPYMPNFEAVASEQESYGLQRLDHAVGNVHVMADTVDYLQRATGFHQFAEFTTEDVGTVDSGLNSQVLASNNEMVILPVNEPTFGTPRKSQIQTYLEQNEGPGLQHLALKTNDVVATLRKMRRVSACGGFDFMPPLDKSYYQKLPEKIGDALTPQQYKDIEELGILADKDDQGILLQIFSKPLSDRPTVFIEIIQRIGCEREVEGADGRTKIEQAGGCGGFGKGNFTALFKSIEEYERTLDI